MPLDTPLHLTNHSFWYTSHSQLVPFRLMDKLVWPLGNFHSRMGMVLVHTFLRPSMKAQRVEGICEQLRHQRLCRLNSRHYTPRNLLQIRLMDKLVWPVGKFHSR
jgi:hypothetical protein